MNKTETYRISTKMVSTANKLNDFYFLKEMGFSVEHGALNYKTIVIKAKTLDDVKVAILQNKKIRDEFLEVSNLTCKNYYDSFENHEGHENHKFVWLLGPKKCNITYDDFDEYIDEYYRTHDIIEDMKANYSIFKLCGYRYMGMNEEAYKEFTKNDRPHDSNCGIDKYNCTDGHNMYIGIPLSIKAKDSLHYGKVVYEAD